MGGHLLTEEVDGKLTRSAMKQWFRERHDQALFESGHDAYSGDWGTLNGGIVFPTEVTFADAQAAVDWLDGHCEKWGDALAVRFHKSETKPVRRPTFGGQPGLGEPAIWNLTGGTAGHPRITAADQLPERTRERVVAMVIRMRSARSAVHDANQALRVTCDSIMALTAVPASRIVAEQHAAKRARAESDAAVKALDALSARLLPRLFAEEVVDLGVMWMVGGFVAS